MFKYQKGLTLIELIIVVGISAMLFALVSVSLLGIHNKTSVRTVTESTVSDIQSQQAKAMTGFKGGGTTSSNYGINFQADKYILFRGSLYNSSDVENLIITLPSDIQISSTSFSSNSIVFTKLTGELFNSTQSGTITIKSINSTEQKTITINKYGVITSVQ